MLSTTMHSFFAMGFVSILWAVVGYTIAFGNADGAFGAVHRRRSTSWG